MATNPRIRYDIEAAVTGEDDVNALANQLEGLANTLEGDLKTQALASAAALRTLGDKQGAIGTFTNLKREVQEASARLTEAQSAAQGLAQRLSSLEQPTRAQAGQLQRLRDNVRASKEEVQRKTIALEQSRNALRAYGINTENLAQSERNVRAAVAAARAEVQTLGPAYARAGQLAAESGRQQVAAANSTREGLRGLGDQLRTVQNLAVAALGGTFVTQLAGDVADTADQFKNLEARVKLATGEGAAFETAFEGIQQIALRTNSELEGTATLFARITQAGRELNLSQEAALSLTETINQSIQLSGGSAEGARAAIVQLVQGLQSGVLRGEEFNSVMEQSPRLARALADGLGVTTGELRKLANQGQLTTEVVLSALQGQSAAVAREFEQLPPTVGRAIQNLSTAWTVYVGNADKATGASAAAAAAINALGQNLDTVIGFLLDLGQAAAAFTALRLAQQFLAIGTAAKTSSVQIAANAAALSASGAAAAGAASNVGRFASLLTGLRTFTLIGLATNFQDIGTFIGETAAKLAGYKDLTEELAREEALSAEISRQNAAQKAALAQQIEIATERARGLTPEAKLLVSEFDKMRSGGKGAADSLAELSKSANLQDTSGIQAFSIALRDLQVQGKASGDQIREAFANALKGEDLAVFEVNARAALSGARNEAELLSTVLDASLREAIRRSGADFAVISGGMGEAARSAINDTELIINNLGRLQEQGVNTADALTASIGRGIQTADSRAAIEALRQQIELVRRSLGDQVANTLLDQLGDKARQVVRDVAGVEDAFRRLGIQTQADIQKAADQARADYQTILQSGEATAVGLQQAFQRYAAAAIAANEGVVTGSLRVEAAMRGLEIVTDGAGRVIVRAMESAADATFRAGQAANGAAGGYRNMAQSAEQAAAAAQRAAQAGERFSSPLGDDRFARPEGGSVTGNTREERLAGQNAVDNTLIFALRDKLNAGALTSDDAQDLRNAIAALDQNEQVNRDLDRLNPAAFSLTGAADRNEWRAIRQQFEQALNATKLARRVTVELRNGRQSETVQTDEEGAAALVRTLRNSALSAGR